MINVKIFKFYPKGPIHETNYGSDGTTRLESRDRAKQAPTIPDGAY